MTPLPVGINIYYTLYSFSRHPSKFLESSFMEDVWKDILTLSSSYQTHSPATVVAHHQSSVHDILASPVCLPTQRVDLKNVCKDIRHGQQVCDGGNSPTLSSIFGSSAFPSICSQKRGSEDNNGCGDRRYKRKMKNRESATRSRARREAYTNELELEVAHLRKENAMLRIQQEEMSSAAAAADADNGTRVPKKSTLLRSLTAPF